jgi:hypothetical protein
MRCSPAAVDARLPPERIGKKMDAPVASQKAGEASLGTLDAGTPPAGVEERIMTLVAALKAGRACPPVVMLRCRL